MLQTPPTQAPAPVQVPAEQVGRQACSTTSQLSTGPHWAHCFPGALPAGHATGQPIFVHASSPSMHVQSLQLNGSLIPLAPFG
jgi:hypothetical protein